MTLSAGAQEVTGRYELAGGVGWNGTVKAGTAEASETTADAQAYRLFSAASQVGQAVAVDARVGAQLDRALEADVLFSYARPTLSTRLEQDTEGAAPTTSTERMRQFLIEGGFTLRPPGWRIGSRGFPFLTATGGYLRRLHEGDTLAEAGWSGSGGGGLSFFFVDPSRPGHPAGIRVDARARVRAPRLSFDRRVHVSPVVGAAVFVRF